MAVTGKFLRSAWNRAPSPRKSTGNPAAPDHARTGKAEQWVAAVRAALGEEAFAAAWAEGRAMTVEEASRCAVER